jgi:acyl-CoA thioester hydrolase
MLRRCIRPGGGERWAGASLPPTRCTLSVPGGRLTDSRIAGTVRFRVRYAETDQMGVVYHANYLVWCEVGRTELIRSLGPSYASLERQGVLLAVSEASLRFHAPARYDDLVVVETRVESVRSRTITFSYLISRQDEESRQRLVSATTTLVALDAASRPRSMPPPLLELFRAPAARTMHEAGDV